MSGRLALYVLALKASCYDLNSLTFTLNQKSETLLTHLKRQMEQEKEHIACECSVCRSRRTPEHLTHLNTCLLFWIEASAK